MPQHSLSRPNMPFARLRRTATSAAALALVLFAGAACSDDDDPVAPTPVSMSLSETSVTLVRLPSTPQPTKQIEVELEGTSNTGVTWTAYRPEIATISATGLITGLADGQTYFTATSDADPTINRTVVVNVVSTTISTNFGTLWSWVGGPTRTITATVANNPNTNVTWSSSNTAVATVSAAGVVTPVATGTATITAASVADPTKTASTAFTVDPAVLTTTAGGATITPLTSGTGVSGLSATPGQFRYYRIEVPPGATNLTVATTGATSDIDLFVLAAAVPTVTYTNALPARCFAATASGNETCNIANPQSRVYYVMIDAYEAYSGVTLTAAVTAP